MAGNANRCKCINVRDTIDFQCFISLSGVLVDILDYGRSIFWREVFQMCRRRRGTASDNRTNAITQNAELKNKINFEFHLVGKHSTSMFGVELHVDQF